jgi:hypothetical protein
MGIVRDAIWGSTHMMKDKPDAAQKVTVKGTLKGETLMVESVLPAK